MVDLYWINDITTWVWQTSVKASLVVVGIACLQWLLRNRLSAKWMHALWLLLLLRLLLPGNFESRLSFYNLTNRVQPPVTVLTNTLYQETLLVNEQAPKEMTTQNVSVAADPQNPNWKNFFILGWIIGVGFFLIYSLIINIRFMTLLKQKQPVESPHIQHCLNACKKRMGIRSRIQIFELDKISTPMLFGLFKPMILLPKSCMRDLTQNQWQHILCHELAHFKRQDILISHLTTLFQIIHWFNPLLWLAFYKLRQDREIACDALVLNRLGQQGKTYGKTLIRLLELFHVEQFRPLTVGIIENKKDLKRRLQNIVKPKKQTLIWSVITLIVATVLGCALLTEARKPVLKKKTVLLEVSPKPHSLFSTNISWTTLDDSTECFEADTIWMSNYQLRSDTTKYLNIFGINLKGLLIDSLHLKITADSIRIDTLDHLDNEAMRISKQRNQNSYIDEHTYAQGDSSIRWLDGKALLRMNDVKHINLHGTKIQGKFIKQISPNRFETDLMQGEILEDGVHILTPNKNNINYMAKEIIYNSDSSKVELFQATAFTENVTIESKHIVIQIKNSQMDETGNKALTSIRQTYIVEDPKGILDHMLRNSHGEGGCGVTVNGILVSNDSTKRINLTIKNFHSAIRLDSIYWKIIADTIHADSINNIRPGKRKYRNIKKILQHNISKLTDDKALILTPEGFIGTVKGNGGLGNKKCGKVQTKLIEKEWQSDGKKKKGIQITIIIQHSNIRKYKADHIHYNADSTEVELVGNAVLTLDSTQIFANRIFLDWNESGGKALNFISPIQNGHIADKFGYRYHPVLKKRKFHPGVDIPMPKGTRVLASADGIVKTASANHKEYGNYVVLEHAFGYETKYQHLDKFIIQVGQKVVKGELIGYVGKTGRTTGPHLHFELIKNGKPVDPEDYIEIATTNQIDTVKHLNQHLRRLRQKSKVPHIDRVGYISGEYSVKQLEGTVNLYKGNFKIVTENEAIIKSNKLKITPPNQFENENLRVESLQDGIHITIDQKIKNRWKYKADHIHFNTDSTEVELIGNAILTLDSTQIFANRIFLDWNESGGKALNFIPPIHNGQISLKFGYRYHPIFKKRKFHPGVDFPIPKGTPVLASADGIIKKINVNHKDYGKYIQISHKHSYETKYAHLDTILIQAGQKVSKGETISHVGKTGRAVGNHLHFELIKNGKPVDPEDYIDFNKLKPPTYPYQKPETSKQKSFRSYETSIFSSVVEPVLHPFKENGLYGFRDKSSKVIIAPQFEKASYFSERYTEVKKDGKWGYIDKKGDWVLKPIFDSARGFNDGMAEVQLDGKWGFIDEHFQMVIQSQYDNVYYFSEGLANVQKNNKWGSINKNGKVVVDFKYNKMGSFLNNYASVENNQKWGFINREGKIVIPIEYEKTGYFSEGLAAVRINGKYGYINTDNEFVIPPRFQEADHFSEDRAAVKMPNNKYGFIDKTGTLVIEAKYDMVMMPFTDGYAGVIIFENPEKGIKGQSLGIDRFGNKTSYAKERKKLKKESTFINIHIKKNEILLNKHKIELTNLKATFDSLVAEQEAITKLEPDNKSKRQYSKIFNGIHFGRKIDDDVTLKQLFTIKNILPIIISPIDTSIVNSPEMTYGEYVKEEMRLETDSLKNQQYKPPYPKQGWRNFYKSIEYPKAAQKAGWIGRIYAIAHLNNIGNVTQIEFPYNEDNTDQYGCYHIVKKAIENTQWQPATIQDGQPNNGLVEINVLFPTNQWCLEPSSSDEEGEFEIVNFSDQERYIHVPYFHFVRNSETLMLDNNKLVRGKDYALDNVMTFRLSKDLKIQPDSKLIFKFKYRDTPKKSHTKQESSLDYILPVADVKIAEDYGESGHPVSKEKLKTYFDHRGSRTKKTNQLKKYYENGKTGLKDSLGNIIVKPQFFRVGHFSEGMAVVEIKTGIYNTMANVLDKKYQNFRALADKRYGYINEQGKIIIKPKYEGANHFSEGLASVEKDGKFGFIDNTENMVIDFQYDNAGIFINGLANVKLNDKWGFINKKGECVIPCEYDDVGYFYEGLASATKNDKDGYINKKNELVIPLNYDRALPFMNNHAIVQTGNKWGVINKAGQYIVESKFYRIQFECRKEYLLFKGYNDPDKKTGGISVKIDRLGNVIPIDNSLPANKNVKTI